MAAGMLATAGTASANLYCVNKPPCTGGTEVATFKGAVDSANAHAGPDEIQIGAGTYPFTSEATGNGTAGQDLTIAGAGRDQTILQGGGVGTRVLTANNANTAISDLTFELQAANSTSALYLRGGRVDRVDVTGTGGTTTTGIYMVDGADATDVRVLLPTTPIPANHGMSIDTNNVASSELRRVEVRGRYAATLTGQQPIRIREGRFRARTAGLTAQEGVSVDADGLLVELDPDSSGNAILASSYFATTTDTVFDLRHATIVGSGSGNQYAFDLNQDSGHESRIVGRNVIVSGIPKDASFYTEADPVGSTAKLDLAYSTALRSAPTTFGPVGSYSVVTGDGMIPSPADPGFVNAPGGDFALLSTSPYVDMGEPGDLSGAQSPVDLLGAPRIADGNGDGTARRDVGAFEFQPAPVVVPISATGTTPATTTTPPATTPGLVLPRNAPRLVLAFGRIIRLDRRRRLVLPVRCPSGLGRCTGTLDVRTASAIAAQRRRRVVRLGSVRYSVPAGGRANVVVRVSRANAALVRRRRSLPVIVRARTTDGSGITTRRSSLRPPRRRR